MIFGRYMRWLHTGWPAGTVEKLPEVNEDGTTAVTGVRVVGDLTGVPLLKFSADTGARAVQAILREDDFLRTKGRDPDVLDLAIIGAGVSGIAAAVEAKREGLRFQIYEAAQEFNTIQNFPKGKPIFTYPTEMKPAGGLQVSAAFKESLLEELESQRRKAGVEITKAHVDHIERKGGELIVVFGGKEKKTARALRVIIAIGRTGNYRQLGVAGEKLDKVYQRLYDPKEYAGKRALVVGGGDSALETAIALELSGAEVTIAYHNKEFARPKPENAEKIKVLVRDPDADVSIEQPVSERTNPAMGAHQIGKHGSLRLLMASKLKEIRPDEVALTDEAGQAVTLPNDVVFAMIGREAPLDFFRRSGVPIRGEWRGATWASFAAFFAFCFFVYTWKAGTDLNSWFSKNHYFPFNLWADTPLKDGVLQVPGAFMRALVISLRQPGFYYSTAYCVAIALFGWKRIQRRKTPYVRRQTLTLMIIQIVPLFLVPYFILPMLGTWGAFDSGIGKTIADNLFPTCGYDYGREYWRAFGLILAWPLFFWNFFTGQPMKWWLIIGSIQTFVLIPLIIRRWGKGAYCGWICSCGALAETLGDTHRQKMPHGPRWNRLNMLGQVILAIVFALFLARIVTWYSPGSSPGKALQKVYDTAFYSHSLFDYYHVVDIFLAGVVGVGLYFWFSGRVWCRFACPLAALMHIYARFSRFRIFADKKKCISCNVCTSVCHQGIDIMNFANKGMPMEDPECVRCSACVQSCPTGTLTFGRLSSAGTPVFDRLAASPVQMAELKIGADGKKRLPLVA
ncbi:MAG: 4Fe-4S binding protein [Myxococcales bacterium]|nr:4Fe-4S binding protein [Myxococcales bacterium]